MSQQRLLDELLGLSPSADAATRLGEPLLVVRMYPSFRGERALSLHRSAAGEYVLRSARLIEGESNQAGVKKHVGERGLDEGTATALLELWQAIVARAQTVHEVGAATGKGDGIIYSIAVANSGAVTHSPRPGSVLDQAASSAELLFARVDDPSDNDDTRLRSAQSQMQLALGRTRREESCLMPYVEAASVGRGKQAP